MFLVMIITAGLISLGCFIGVCIEVKKPIKFKLNPYKDYYLK